MDSRWNSVSKYISEVEKSFTEIQHEEIPRALPQVQTAADRRHNLDEQSHGSWDDDTLSSNFCSDHDNDEV
jgi:hypothetical protein